LSKFVHIVFGDSAAGTLNYFFQNNENEYNGKIINFREDASIGPIYEIDTEDGLKKRIEWFKKIFKEISANDYFEDIEKGFLNMYKSIKNIKRDSKIVIWHGENTGDQVGFRYLCSILKNRELYEVNVSESYIRDYNNNRYNPRTLAEYAPEEIYNVILTIKKLRKEKYNDLTNDWDVLRTSKEKLRILKNNEIIEVDENYYDNDILSHCTFNFNNAAKIVGITMGNSHHLVGDTYLDYRVRKLIDSGKLEYKGNFKNLRDFEIKILRVY
jgi:uncharacterized protein DUF1835/uncharacterized protein DUF3658